MGILLFFTACGPKEPVTLRQIDQVAFLAGTDPVLSAEAVMFNPNNNGGKLKKLFIEIFVDDQLAGTIDEDLNIHVSANSEFRVPFKVKLSLKDSGFLDTLLNIFGARKVDVKFKGYLKMSLSVVPVKVPIEYVRQIRI